MSSFSRQVEKRSIPNFGDTLTDVFVLISTILLTNLLLLAGSLVLDSLYASIPWVFAPTAVALVIGWVCLILGEAFAEELELDGGRSPWSFVFILGAGLLLTFVVQANSWSIGWDVAVGIAFVTSIPVRISLSS